MSSTGSHPPRRAEPARALGLTGLRARADLPAQRLGVDAQAPQPLAARLGPQEAAEPAAAPGALRRAATPTLSCIVPAYNEAANLPLLLQSLVPVLQGLVPHWEVVVVDDGSSDNTSAVLQPWLHRPGVRCLTLSRNFGKEAALTAGLEHAQGDVVLMLDADGQHPLRLLPQMLQLWREGADAVCAVRESRADETWGKRLGTALFYRIVNRGSPVPIPPNAGDFRLMDRRVVDALKALPECNRFMKGLYAWVGFNTAFISYVPAPRAHGRSSFSVARLLTLAVTGLTAFSTLPLRLWSGLGAAVALAALGYGAYIVLEHLQNGHPVPGWPTVVVSLMFFSGVQLLSIGILGEYIGRIFSEVKRRPVYVLRDVAGQGLIEPRT